MKRTWTLTALLFAVVVGGIAGCSKTEQPPAASGQAQTNAVSTVQYTCRMHPEVVQNTPGKCPKCGMELIEKK